ncbi:uncharacterized protein LOC127374427 isoform X15 [Dicentrarchus labrax]|uniref:uncharacterized protein LOC127374427 isoform X11 n=1 Tax=Dicentrarchus labrax TaxID=13489 RepID=UPI0021F67552|nr:uncharacterized protein LOC127374427 isoform X11 [Dicentrarchus labrax]XP_051275661.1 uncharacterized protein LOC127374427 isoform X12 [Dicentrarchus labrax]XP_051275662.1 uncharacterized protein LOC127374427 isoform X13 [Dicentrarchus labrax]XP_051275663.1 uncharacterized protein LOC127374427 isoform X14 [Dicentrarchus labrax]XP_051275664.1 uncharacterized protein LOC127374427 isoform X15 [Dicentrarchus labrax]
MPLTMKPDRNNDFEGVGEEMSSNSLTEKELTPPEREEDHQQEDPGEENDPISNIGQCGSVCHPMLTSAVINNKGNKRPKKKRNPSNSSHTLISEFLDTIDLFRKIYFNTVNTNKSHLQSPHKVKRNRPKIKWRILELFLKRVSARGPLHTPPIYDHEKNKGKEKQYASAFLVLRNGECVDFPEVKPVHSKKTSECTKHSEEILIGEIDEYLRSNVTKVQSISFYTVNSPCLKRHGKEKHIPCCMLQLIDKAYQWYNEYGIITSVRFRNCWGPFTPSLFKSLEYSNISSRSCIFFGYFKEFKKTPFELDSKFQKSFRNKVKADGIFETRSDDTIYIDRNKLNSAIKDALGDLVKLGTSSHTFKEHMLRGEELISSLEFPALVQNKIFEILRKNWKEMVENGFMSVITKEITADLNTATVHAFLEFQTSLGNSSPFHLYQIP